ncbi:MAG: hypothetical protein WDO15_27210 [Bacteroidota bacterium]
MWRERKLKETDQLIKECAGLYSEVTASEYYVAPGEMVKLNFEIVNRSMANVKIEINQEPDTWFRLCCKSRCRIQ